MKLIYISEGNLPSRSANSIQVAKMAAAFARKLSDFELVTMGDLRSLLLWKRFDFCKWYGFSKKFKITCLPLLFKIAYPFPERYRNNRFPKWAVFYAALKFPDVVYTPLDKIALMALRLNLAVVLEIHGPIEGRLFKQKAFNRGRFLGAVLVTDELIESCIENGLSKEKITVEYNGADIQENNNLSKGIARQRLDFPSDIKIVVYGGHLYDNRGIEEIFSCAKRMPEVLFVLVGGWDEDVKRRREEIEKLRLTNVRFVGFVVNAQLPLYLAAADVLLMPYSRRLNSAGYMSPMKMFDYMAAKRPIIASDLPTIRHILKDHHNALLVEPDNADALYNGLKTILQDKSLMERLASQAYKDIQYYSWDKRAERVLRFITDRLVDIRRKDRGAFGV